MKLDTEGSFRMVYFHKGSFIPVPLMIFPGSDPVIDRQVRKSKLAIMIALMTPIEEGCDCGEIPEDD